MALTRAQVEQILVERVGGWLTEAGLATTANGDNAALNDAIGYAVRRIGGTVANVTLVADGDLSGIAADDYDALFDIAEWRALENILKHLAKVDVRMGPLAQSYSQLRRDVMDAAKQKRGEIEVDYAFLGAQLQAGSIALDISLKDEDLELSDA
jgi:hypothetical protein